MGSFDVTPAATFNPSHMAIRAQGEDYHAATPANIDMQEVRSRKL